MARKKRSGGATGASSSHAPAARELPPPKAFNVEKSTALRHYEELLMDPVRTPWTLDRSLWLHSVIGMFVHSALVYDEVQDLQLSWYELAAID